MKTILSILLFQIPMLLHAQKKFYLKPDASGNIVVLNFKATYKPVKGDSIIVQGSGIRTVQIDSVCLPDCSRVPLRFDTAAPVVVTPPANDTLYLTASYIVKTSPNNQKLKWANTTTGGQIYLPSAPPSGFAFTLVNNTGKSIQCDKHLVYRRGKNWKTPDSYRVTFYQGTSSVWWDGKRYMIKQL